MKPNAVGLDQWVLDEKYDIPIYNRSLMTNYVYFSQMLRELIPGDLVKVQSANDWKRSIIAAYNQDAGIENYNLSST